MEYFAPLARNCARRYEGRGEPAEDLSQVAMIGLIRAIDRFDPDRGISFRAYAIPTILGELRRHFRDHGWMLTVPRRVKERRAMVEQAAEQLGQIDSCDSEALAAQTGLDVATVTAIALSRHAYRPLPLDGLVEATTALPDDELERLLDRCVVDDLLRVLPPRERQVIRLRLHDELTQAQVGAALGISQVHAGRLFASSLARLRQCAGSSSDVDGLRRSRNDHPGRG